MEKRKIGNLPFFWDLAIVLPILVILCAFYSFGDWWGNFFYFGFIYLFFRGIYWASEKKQWICNLVLIGSFLAVLYRWNNYYSHFGDIPWHSFTWPLLLHIILTAGVASIFWALGFYRRRRFGHKDRWARAWLALSTVVACLGDTLANLFIYSFINFF